MNGSDSHLEWIRFFDSGLPGFGVIVEIQDQNNGDEGNNLVNTDPEKRG